MDREEFHVAIAAYCQLLMDSQLPFYLAHETTGQPVPVRPVSILWLRRRPREGGGRYVRVRCERTDTGTGLSLYPACFRSYRGIIYDREVLLENLRVTTLTLRTPALRAAVPLYGPLVECVLDYVCPDWVARVEPWLPVFCIQ